MFVRAVFPDLAVARLIEPFKRAAHDRITDDKGWANIIVFCVRRLPVR
jgi:hypothetical protein